MGCFFGRQKHDYNEKIYTSLITNQTKYSLIKGINFTRDQ